MNKLLYKLFKFLYFIDPKVDWLYLREKYKKKVTE